MKILNLYAGIGGNRKLWGDEHEVTSVEHNEEIAAIYHHYFPGDTMIVGDAHEFLKDNFEGFDFIWSSPPCPSHSRVRKATRHQNKPVFPDMKLYEEILFLRHYFRGRWVVENVIPYYRPLIPARELHRHLFWTNFDITYRDIPDERRHDAITSDSIVYGYNLKDFKVKNRHYDKVKILRNMVNPKLGLYILSEALGKRTEVFEQGSLF